MTDNPNSFITIGVAANSVMDKLHSQRGWQSRCPRKLTEIFNRCGDISLMRCFFRVKISKVNFFVIAPNNAGPLSLIFTPTHTLEFAGKIRPLTLAGIDLVLPMGRLPQIADPVIVGVSIDMVDIKISDALMINGPNQTMRKIANSVKANSGISAMSRTSYLANCDIRSQMVRLDLPAQNARFTVKIKKLIQSLNVRLINLHSHTQLLIVKQLRKGRGVGWKARGPPANFSVSYQGSVKPAGEQGLHAARSLKPHKAREGE